MVTSLKARFAVVDEERPGRPRTCKGL